MVADTGKGCLMYRLAYVHGDLYGSACVRLCVCVCVCVLVYGYLIKHLCECMCMYMYVYLGCVVSVI